MQGRVIPFNVNAAPTITHAAKDRVAVEARLLFSLLDALNSSGVLAPEVSRRLDHVRRRLEINHGYDFEAQTLFEMLEQAANTGVMRGSWVEARWNALLARVGKGPL